jgi:hypothetical protein
MALKKPRGLSPAQHAVRAREHAQLAQHHTRMAVADAGSRAEERRGKPLDTAK